MLPEGEAYDELVAIVEIPAGSNLKTELDPGSGKLETTRHLDAGMRYPINYGQIPGTLAGDGDPLDVLVFSRAPLAAGTVLTVRPVALLSMRDSGNDDPKVVAIPSRATTSVGAAGAFPDELRQRIEEFFRHYKIDPETGLSAVQVTGWQDAGAARSVISNSIANFVRRDFLEHSLNSVDQSSSLTESTP